MRHTPTHPALDAAELFRSYARFVASFLHRLGAPHADIDDLVQEVFLNAHRRGGYQPGLASPATFLAHLALEANLKRRRQRGRNQRDCNPEAARAAVGQGPPDPAQELSEKRAAARAEAAMAALEEGQRSVFILFELEGESCESIAAGLSLPVGTVYSRLHAARRRFREQLARDLAATTSPSERSKSKALMVALEASPLSRRRSS